jgi:hypothetical protein
VVAESTTTFDIKELALISFASSHLVACGFIV